MILWSFELTWVIAVASQMGVSWGLSLSFSLSLSLFLSLTHTYTLFSLYLLIFTKLKSLMKAQDIGLHIDLTDARNFLNFRKLRSFQKKEAQRHLGGSVC